MQHCIEDGGRPSEVALQGEASNHPKLLRLRAGVVSVVGKVALPVRQVRARKASASEPLMKCRKRIDDIKTEAFFLSRDKSGGNLFYRPGGVRHAGGASLVQASMWNVGTCRLATPSLRYRSAAKGSSPSSRNCKGPSTDARHRGGSPRSSDEARVMRAERRGRAVRVFLTVNQERRGGMLTQSDPAGNWGDPNLVVHDGPGEQTWSRRRHISSSDGMSR